MRNNYPNPWDFDNSDAQLISPDGKNKIEYSNLGEIGMGAPLGGSCDWINSDGLRIKLHDWCAGPSLWNNNGEFAAIPIWTRSWLRTIQKIAILSITTRELVIYKPTFDVLDIRTFDGTILNGIDSPAYNSKELNFDLMNNSIETKRKL